MKVVFLSSNGVACGIADYTDDVARALARKGVECAIVDSTKDWGFVTETTHRLLREGYDIVHIQYETLISGSWDRLRDLVASFRAVNPNVQIFVTLHRTGEDTVNGAMSLGGNVQIMVSQEHTFHHLPNVHIVPMGCPAYPERDKAAERQHINVPQEAILLSTFGFLVKWKKTNELIAHLAPHMRNWPDLYVQLLCAFNSFADPGEGQAMADDIRHHAALNGVQDRISLVTDFLPREEVNHRLSASDLGFIFSPMHTGSTSAANKDFIAARCPLFLTDSNHHWDIRQGVVRTTGSLDLQQFVVQLLAVARDPELQNKLRGEMRGLYDQVNWDRVIDQHIALYGRTAVPA